MDVSENSGFYPQIIHFNRVFHYFHHPFWGVSLFLETPISDGWDVPHRRCDVHQAERQYLGGFALHFFSHPTKRCSLKWGLRYTPEISHLEPKNHGGLEDVCSFEKTGDLKRFQPLVFWGVESTNLGRIKTLYIIWDIYHIIIII